MSTVDVTIQENPVPVTVDTGTPAVTITNNQDQSVVVIEAEPVRVTAAEDKPTVIVNTGVGGAIDISLMLSMLTDKLTVDHMSSDLADNLQRLESLWTRIGNELLLTYPEGLALQEAGRQYTDASIQDTVADINIGVEGKIDIAFSSIEQTANAIDQRVTSIKGETDSRLEVSESRIVQTESSIASTVSRLDTVDGPGGSVSLIQSAIDQQADRISLEVESRESVDGDLQQTKSSLALLGDTLQLLVQTLDTITGRVTATELLLGEEGITLSTLEQLAGYSVSAVQDILKNKWGVTIEEDVNGNLYSAGFDLVVHPVWLLEYEYSIGDTAYHNDTAYKALVDHVSALSNAPDSTNADAFWEELPDGYKSAFAVLAERFFIQSPTGPEPMFTISDDVASINTDLIVNSLTSQNYGHPTESWFKLDPITGLAEFGNMTLRIGSGSTGYENLEDKPTSLADINPGEFMSLGGDSVSLIHSWMGSETLTASGTEGDAASWVFDSEYTGGAVIQIEVPDDFTGRLEASLNGVQLTTTLHESGELEDDPIDLLDLNRDGSDVDLGSIA